MSVKINRKVVAIGGAGVLVGAFFIFGIRFVTYKPIVKPHYHANFAVYTNGQRKAFSNPLIYEEITSCKVEIAGTITPSERAHMHNLVNDVVHVEDKAVTWGNFFQNIDWNVNSRYVDNSDKVLMADDTNKVSFILNGEEINDPTARVIDSKDRLLVSYGSSTKDELQKQYDSIASTAEKYNVTKDPASCSGGHNTNSLKDRMKHLF